MPPSFTSSSFHPFCLTLSSHSLLFLRILLFLFLLLHFLPPATGKEKLPAWGSKWPCFLPMTPGPTPPFLSKMEQDGSLCSDPRFRVRLDWRPSVVQKMGRGGDLSCSELDLGLGQRVNSKRRSTFFVCGRPQVQSPAPPGVTPKQQGGSGS